MAERDELLQSLLVAYIEATEAGCPPSREEPLARHPEFAAELAEFLDGRERIERAVAPLHPAPASPSEMLTLPPTEGYTVRPLSKVRQFGEYELLDEIARGGMGVVYKARQVSLKRIVALKMILAGQFASPAEVQRFRTEAESAAHLDHPNIVPIYEVGDHEGQHYFSMKWIDGGSLASRKQLAADPRTAATLLERVARAVHHAHQRGILHRDLKPSNILIDGQGEPHVTDFGLARRVEAESGITQSGAILGTPSYMAPEQARAEKGLSTAVDVYSLGATLYELLTGRPPFQAATPLDTLLQVIEREPENPRSLNPRADRDLETICLKCLEKDLSKRYRSAEAFAEDLERWLNGEPIQARPVGTAERAWRWCRRNKAMAAALSGVALLLVALVIGSFLAALYFQRQEKEQRDLADRNEKLAGEKEKERENAVQAGNEAEAARKREAAQAQELRQNLYHAEMNLAGQAADSPGGLGRVVDLLTPWRQSHPDLRGWEWFYLHGLSHQELMTFRGHSAAVRSGAWSPDGTRLASAGADGTLKVWETATGREVLSLHGHGGGATSLAWSPDGTRLASAGWEGTMKVWQASTGKETFTLQGHTKSVRSVAWSPDSTQLVSGSEDRTVRLWDGATGKNIGILRGHTADVLSVAWSPDRTRVASGGADTVKVWDTATGKPILDLPGDLTPAVAWNGNGTRLAGGWMSAAVHVWDTAAGKETVTLTGHTRSVSAVAWIRDGNQLASASHDRTIKLWDAAIGKEICTLRSTAIVNSVAWSPDGSRLASGSDDGAVKVWAAAATRDRLILRDDGWGVFSVAWSPDGTRLATGNSGGTGAVKIWDLVDGKKPVTLRGHTTHFNSVAWSPDGTRLASASNDKTVTVWDPAGNKEPITLHGHAHWVESVAWSPDGTRLASGSDDNTVKVWDPAAGKELLTFRGHTNFVISVAWSPDGTQLASAGSHDQAVKVWVAASGKETLTLRHKALVRSVAWIPDGTRLASASDDHMVHIWQAASGKELLTLRGHTSSVESVAWSPDSTRLASAASAGGAVKVWDTASGKELLSLGGHTKLVHSVAWSPDGTRLASAGWDNTILVHDATAGYAAERAPRLLPVLDRRLAADPKNLKDLKLRAEIHASLQDWDKAAADLLRYFALSKDRQRWCPIGWWVVGPYPENLEESYPPEKSPNPQQPVAGANPGSQPLRWQSIPLDANGFVDFAAQFGAAEHISAYALMRVYAAEKQSVAVFLGSDDGMRLWHNGQLVHDHPESRLAAPDQDAVAVTLEAGWNTLLARVVNITGPHSLYLRISSEPADRMRASVQTLSERGQWDDAERMVTAELAREPDHSVNRAVADEFYRHRGDADAHRGDWARVAADYAQLMKLTPEDHWVWYRAVVVQAHLGNRAEYRRLCQEMLQRFGATTSPGVAEMTAKSCLLLPGIVKDQKTLTELAALAVTKEPADSMIFGWVLQTRGLADHRAGRFADGAVWLEKSLMHNPSLDVQATARFMLAIGQHQRGQKQAAQATFARALEITTREMPSLEKSGAGWHDWLINDLLRREAAELIERKTEP
jgi:WD40 repeat protein